ncbi:GMC oxidoreductase C-terminal domain-containing protein [Phanerochaete sordida]|uniref:GMC oxidoreductase C-terminal domain-containing protein n=1 Tax=Phanerochaete sordida TaxID=48140 RepID=A0A9P3GND5_9APHY|nr:GMC oxidoreductase C-terminal domain-containing protein [Phanerochaete sordida]
MPYASLAELGKRYMSLFCVLTRSLSRRMVYIASVDPLAPPAIDPNDFASKTDLALVVRVVQLALKVYGTPLLADHVTKTLLPPPDPLAKGEEGICEYVKANSGPVSHPVGTVAMMPREDGGVAVDLSLKVYGTSNVRVVDCSIMPLELSCHTQSFAYAIGGRGHPKKQRLRASEPSIIK